ncbi:hypothetical protein BCM14_1276 [Jezberella montanilacus]|jgi:hypothetical protein|uniref:Uncharacterized protein n=1 Tax=Jezberella montanilacus TaxID=323426 RepID=A0A2T0XHL8_9BURK|nr:hypothetical protein [Jezberella montanilacus]PRY98448.1 hypothetical protein BCM14_1276 [Jezberella montanilacus]
MIIPLSAKNRRQDSRLLQNICLRLAWLPVLIRVLVVGIVAVAWYSVCISVLKRTDGLRYESFSWLSILGPQVLDFLNRINWYIWAGLLLIITLFILGGIRSYLIQSMATGRNALVPLEIIQELSEQLSPEALDVLRWVWKDKEVPINYGNMRMALRQLRSGRARKLALAREQKAVIDAALAANAAASTVPTETPAQAPRSR